MSSEDNKLKYIKNEQLTKNNENINNILIKPIPINPKLIKNQKSDLSTLGNSSINQNSNLPTIYPKINHCSKFSKDSFSSEENKSNNSEINIKKEKINKKKTLLCCNCTKTKCIKKYCECFANTKFCNINCNCQECMNKKDYLDNNNMKYSNENFIIICTCTKSNCNKKYCECYKNGKKCNDKCRCLNCMNSENKPQIHNTNLTINNNNYILYNDNKIDNKIIENNDNINNINNKKEENMNINNNNNLILKENLINENLDEELKIQRISVFINKNQTLINVEKFNKEEMNLLCKKRKHIHNCNNNQN